MEFSRTSIAAMKADIKRLAAEQKEARPQRKADHHFSGVRTLSPAEAFNRHYWNRINLMHMYHVYAIMRGKEPIAPKHKELNQNSITKLFNKYGTIVCADTN